MTRRNESVLASTALALLLAMTLLYGCRAFDPEPVILNRPPDTWIVGAPAETTGGRFQRHLYWFGSDVDGQVVQYIYAITDSTVQKPNDPDGLDEENERFNPALDVTTLIDNAERKVGWTTKSDSVFTFVVDRGSVTAKDVTFHIVAVDDRGAIDRTPARLHFFDNSLGNPEIRFELYIDEGPGGTAPPEWKLHWVGSRDQVDLAASPESSSRPFIGFGRRFRLTWDASSPNGPIVGYRFKATQDDGGFTPPAVEGRKQWDLGLTEMVYQNDRPPSTLPAACDSVTAVGCSPDEVRFSSGNYVLSVEALDAALVESAPGAGEISFEVNYPPETMLFRGQDDVGEVWPRFELRDANWNLLSESSFSDGDTVPAGAYVKFRSSGFDRVPAFAGAQFDSFCCDEVLDPSASEVRYQARLDLVAFDGRRNLRFSNVFSTPDVSDSIGFVTGPFEYSLKSRTVDEHRRPDPSSDELHFVAGYPPLVTSIGPATGDTIVFRAPVTADRWPENEYPYTVSSSVSKWWDGRQYLDTDCGAACSRVLGNIYTIRPRFEGQGDPREAATAVRAWTYSAHSENDPENVIGDGPGESPDLSFYNDSPLPNVWDFTEAEGFQIFVPFQIWFQPDQFDPAGLATEATKQGAELRRSLGEITLRVRARTTSLGDDYDLYQNTRPEEGANAQTIDIARFGRRSAIAEVKYHVLLGIDDAFTGSIQRYWPDF